MPAPPGGDDDQPITVAGGSLHIYWPEEKLWTRVTDAKISYNFSQLIAGGTPGAADAKSRKVILTLGDDDPQTIVNPDGKLTVTLRMKFQGTLRDELAFTTDADGHNLTLDTKSIPTLAYLNLGPGHLQHPHQARKVEEIKVAASGSTLTFPVPEGDFSLVLSCQTGI